MATAPIIPFIWLRNEHIAEAARFYASLFPDNDPHLTIHYETEDASKVFSASVRVLNLEFVIFGEPPEDVVPNYAISFGFPCKTQQEIDRLWDLFMANGSKEIECGWLSDKFGVSWQVFPEDMEKWMSDGKKRKKLLDAMMGMKKLDLAKLKKVYEEQ